MDLTKLIETTNFRPERMTLSDAWIGHIPFGYWLIKTLNPSILVELGVYSGNSYLSFCQSIADNKLPTKCFGIDTWEGDEHGGFYGNDIYAELENYHEDKYSGFSKLVRSTFDEAQKYFLNNSIDLLHIDGLHTYEAVKHDYETWLPKLSANAVILFHDINVRERGFGVWKVWEELCEIYDHNFEFDHSNGLGIIEITDNDNPSKLEFLNQDFPYKNSFKNFFIGSGQKTLDQFYAQENNRKFIEQKNQNENLQQQYESNLSELTKLLQINSSLQQQVEQGNLQITSLQQQVEQGDLQIELFKSEHDKQSNKQITLETKISTLEKNLNELKIYLNERELTLKEINSKLLEIYGSTAWKMIIWMWRLRLFLFPSGSYREKLGKKIFQLLKKNKHRKKLLKKTLKKINPEELLPLYSKEVEDPKVSIIIPVHNQKELTVNCLYSLVQNNNSIPFEVIIIDDSSKKGDYDFLSNLQGVKYYRNEENKGYLLSCNEGAKYADGEFLLFLNNDTSVLDGWLEELIWPFDNLKDVGLVGAKLLYPDGRLQEAGGIIWQDGSGLNFGKNDDPEKPVYNYLRKSD